MAEEEAAVVEVKMIKKIMIVVSLLAMLIIVGCSSGSENYDALAQCLTENEVVMYGTEWCSHCQNQKAAFGKSFQYVNYIDCDQNKDACTDAGVTGYPTWSVKGKNYPGEQPLERLASLAGC